MKDAWIVDEKVEALRLSALALSRAWQDVRDARREGRPYADQMALARTLAKDVVAQGTDVVYAMGRAAEAKDA